jgi:hypothetical protein
MLDLMGQLAQLRTPRTVLGDGNAAQDALLDCADPATDARVLLIGSDTLELMCALIRRGCVGVAVRRPGDRPETASADLVLVPHAASVECIDQALAQARRALVPMGGVVVCLPEHAPAALLQHAERGLRLHGFSAVRTRRLAGQVLLSAELPLFGRLAA